MERLIVLLMYFNGAYVDSNLFKYPMTTHLIGFILYWSGLI